MLSFICSHSLLPPHSILYSPALSCSSPHSSHVPPQPGLPFSYPFPLLPAPFVLTRRMAVCPYPNTSVEINLISLADLAPPSSFTRFPLLVRSLSLSLSPTLSLGPFPPALPMKISRRPNLNLFFHPFQ